MTEKELQEIFETTKSDWDGDNAFRGLQILSKYVGLVICGAEHDVLLGPSIDDVLRSGLTREDAIELRRLGWTIEEEPGYFACYV